MANASDALSTPCKELEENLVLFHYGELQDTDRIALEGHIGSCIECSAYLKELDALLPLTIKADEPPEIFWTDYSRELRHKIDSAREKTFWRAAFSTFFQPRLVPAFAVALVLILALTLTIGKGIWPTQEITRDDAALMEVLPVAENLEFFKTMDVLDNLELLESMSSQGGAA